MAGRAIDELSIVLSASADQLSGDLRAAARMVERFKQETDRISGAGTEAAAAKQAAKEAAVRKRHAREAMAEQKRNAKEMKAAHESSFVGRSARAAQGFASSVASAAGSLPVAGLAFGVGAGAAVLGIEGLSTAFEELKSSVNLAAELESTTLAFEVMLKSADAAKSMLTDIRKFAAQTPFNNAELTDSSRKLIAYGIAADQVIPTLRMLGDIASATQTPIGDLSYLYGTLAAQQRAYTRDLYQFANRGIPIWDEVAKVMGKTVSETMTLVEEGRVGFPQVARALESMTKAGGLYAGLTGRQADTFAGVREQLTDALQMGKIKLGKVLIDNLGLKDAAKDLQKFVESIDSGRIAPAVQFIGDLARGVAQVSSEFAKAAVDGAGFFATMAKEIPAVKDSLNQLGSIVDSAKAFKIDPMDVATLVTTVGKDVLQAGGTIVTTIAEAGAALEETWLKPMRETMAFIRDTTTDMKHGKEILGAMINPSKVWGQLGGKALDWADQFDMGPLAGFKNPARRILGGVPGIEGHPAGKSGEAAAADSTLTTRARDFSNRLKEMSEALDKASKGILDRLGDKKRMEETQREIEALQARRKELGTALELQRAIRGGGIGQLQGMIPGDPMAALAGSLPAFQKGFDKSNALAAMGGGPIALARQGDLGPQGLHLPDTIDPSLRDFAKRIREDLNPMLRLERERKDFQSAEAAGLLSPDEAALGFRRQAMGVADGLGINGAVRLPDAAFSGTAEATRAINLALASQQTMGGAKDIPSLLMQIKQAIENRNGQERELIGKIAVPVPAVIPK
jgi:hypothetical protein